MQRPLLVLGLGLLAACSAPTEPDSAVIPIISVSGEVAFGARSELRNDTVFVAVTGTNRGTVRVLLDFGFPPFLVRGEGPDGAAWDNVPPPLPPGSVCACTGLVAQIGVGESVDLFTLRKPVADLAGFPRGTYRVTAWFKQRISSTGGLSLRFLSAGSITLP